MEKPEQVKFSDAFVLFDMKMLSNLTPFITGVIIFNFKTRILQSAVYRLSVRCLNSAGTWCINERRPMSNVILTCACWEGGASTIYRNTVELQWLEHLWNYEYLFETGIVRANEC